MGWWIYDNVILCNEAGVPIINHEAIIPEGREDELFWHVFNQRSPFNIDGTKNRNTIATNPRRYTQADSQTPPAMLKKIVSAADPAFVIRVQPQYNAKSFRTGKYLYSFRVRKNGYSGSTKYMLATEMVDSVYWQALMSHLWQTEDFTDFAKTEEVAQGSKEAEIREAQEQIAACERKIAKLLKRLALVSESGEDDEATLLVLDEIEQHARDEALKKTLKFLTDEIAKFTAEKTRQEKRVQKLEGGNPDTYAAQMVEYHDLLRQLGDRVRELYSIDELLDVVDTFTTGVILDTISPRVWKMTIIWRDYEAWGRDEIISVRIDGNPSVTWLDEERELLRMQYGRSTRRELLEMLPTRSWVGIRCIASDMGLRRGRDDSPNEFPYDICLADWQAIQEYGLSIPVGSNNLLLRSPQAADTTNDTGAVSVGVQLVRSWK